MSTIWLDPEAPEPKRRQVDLPLFEESGLSGDPYRVAGEIPSSKPAQCETGAGGFGSLRLESVPDKAHARRTDPETSHQAAASVTNLGRTRDAILYILRRNGPLTDEQIAEIWKRCEAIGRGSTQFPQCSPSGLRSRRAELVRLGFVEDSGHTGRTAAGRACTIWRLAK